MIDYFLRYSDRLWTALAEHIGLVFWTLVFSLLLAVLLTLLCMLFENVANGLIGVLSMVYSIPSLALFALLIPLTGLGKTTAILALVIYNQYLLLRNFIAGLQGVDRGAVEAATGMGMTDMQILFRIRVPLAKKSLFAGVRLALVSTVGIATMAATINAGGLGTILFDGLRTMNWNKILWGSLFSGGLAIATNELLGFAESKIGS